MGVSFHQTSQSHDGTNDVGSKIRAGTTPCTSTIVLSASERRDGIGGTRVVGPTKVISKTERKGKSENKRVDVGSMAVYGTVRLDGVLKCGRCKVEGVGSLEFRD